LDLSVKVLLAARLVEIGQLDDTAILDQALGSKVLGRRSLAALLLHQLGDAAGTRSLQALDASNDPLRDMIRATLLTTVMRHELDRCADWAHAVALQRRVDEPLGALAMRAALRFADPETMALWRQRFSTGEDAADRMRLAMLALQSSPHLATGEAMFRDLIATDDALLSEIGRAGWAIASEDPRLIE